MPSILPGTWEILSKWRLFLLLIPFFIWKTEASPRLTCPVPPTWCELRADWLWGLCSSLCVAPSTTGLLRICLVGDHLATHVCLKFYWNNSLTKKKIGERKINTGGKILSNCSNCGEEEKQPKQVFYSWVLEQGLFPSPAHYSHLLSRVGINNLAA